MICKHIFMIVFLNELELIFLHTVELLQVLLPNSNSSILPIERILSGTSTPGQS